MAINLQGLVMASYICDINYGDVSLVGVHRILCVCELHGSDQL